VGNVTNNQQAGGGGSSKRFLSNKVGSPVREDISMRTIPIIVPIIPIIIDFILKK